MLSCEVLCLSSCSLSSATLKGERNMMFCDDIYRADAPSRAGFTIDSGCDLSSSWFLPQNLFPWAGKARTYSTYHLGIHWYQGKHLWQSSTSYFTSWTTYSSSGARFNVHIQASQQRTFSVELSTGDTILQHP